MKNIDKNVSKVDLDSVSGGYVIEQGNITIGKESSSSIGGGYYIGGGNITIGSIDNRKKPKLEERVRVDRSKYFEDY